jgi:hypothetical protein
MPDRAAADHRGGRPRASRIDQEQVNHDPSAQGDIPVGHPQRGKPLNLSVSELARASIVVRPP